MKIKYNLKKKDASSGARLGEIEWNGRVYETPMFMPVGTQATVKTLSPEEVADCKAGIILANTYHFVVETWRRYRFSGRWVTQVYELSRWTNFDGQWWISSVQFGKKERYNG